MASKKDRSRRNIARQEGKRREYPRLLIVCEGKETEPQYFSGLRQKLRLPTVDCQIVPSDWGPPPDKVVGYAEHLVKTEGWEEAWCVFDRDEHPYYDQAIRKAGELDGLVVKHGTAPVKFRAVPSDPCIELWFLIHFEPWTREEHRLKIKHHLVTHVPAYEKAMAGMWGHLESYLQSALDHAQVLRRRRSDSVTRILQPKWIF